jgi:hypothetical protein
MRLETCAPLTPPDLVSWSSTPARASTTTRRLDNIERAKKCYAKAGLNDDWQAVVADVRQSHFRKKGFMTGRGDRFQRTQVCCAALSDTGKSTLAEKMSSRSL